MATDHTNLQLVFKYADIKASGEPLNTHLPLELTREALEGYLGTSGYWVDEPMKVSGGVYKTISGEVIIDARVEGEARFLCVSCNSPRLLKVNLREDLVAVPEGHDALSGGDDIHGEGELELDPDVYSFQGPDLDLSPMLRESLVLEVPLHPRCEDVGAACVHKVEAHEEPVEEGLEDVDPRLVPFLGVRDDLLKRIEERERQAGAKRGAPQGSPEEPK
jgi:uncharacterized metal-binding protein YceD (DUF177 family)